MTRALIILGISLFCFGVVSIVSGFFTNTLGTGLMVAGGVCIVISIFTDDNDTRNGGLQKVV